MAESEFSAVAPHDGGHDRTVFDCGAPALNLYLRNYALQNQKKGIVRNYVTTRADSKVVVAYYSPAAFILMGLRYESAMVQTLLRGVGQMRESTTYQAILEEGKAEGIALGESK